MKCHKHNDRDVVSQCVDCGRGLCPECDKKFSIPICDNCLLVRNSRDKQVLIKNLGIMVTLFLVIFFTYKADLPNRLLMSLMFSGVPWGWSILTRITPNMFVFMPIFGWVIYFFIKFVLSLIIGLFVAPYKIFMIIKGLNQAKELDKYTKNYNCTL